MIRKRKSFFKIIGALFGITAALALSVGVAYAFLKEESNSGNGIVNHFNGSYASVEVAEDFDGTLKKNVTAQNTGSAPAYLRIQLAGYRVNDAGQRIGGSAPVPPFVPGDGWLAVGNDLYVYAYPVAPGETPKTDLIGDSGIVLTRYTDADGGRQAVEVIAESLQSLSAVGEAWQVGVSADGTLVLQ